MKWVREQADGPIRGDGRTGGGRRRWLRLSRGPAAGHSAPMSNSGWTSGRAGANGGGRAGRPMHSRIARMTSGWVIVATIAIRPEHRGHSSTSVSQRIGAPSTAALRLAPHAGPTPRVATPSAARRGADPPHQLGPGQPTRRPLPRLVLLAARVPAARGLRRDRGRGLLRLAAAAVPPPRLERRGAIDSHRTNDRRESPWPARARRGRAAPWPGS